MNEFFKKHVQSMVITGIALVILYMEFMAVPAPFRLMPAAVSNPFFVAAGKWGIRFLLLSLLMSPIYAFTGWRFPLKLRKPLGLNAFLFVSIHVAMVLFDKMPEFSIGSWLARLIQPWYVILGLLAFVILSLMAITSFKTTTKMMGKYWKPLHRLVYGAGVLMMLHGMVAARSGKRGFMGGHESFIELRIYLILLIVLLIVRIPMIKNFLKSILPFAPNPRKSKSKRSMLIS